MAIICLLSLLPSISVLANENYITDPATSLRGKSDSAVPTRLQRPSQESYKTHSAL